MIESWYLGILWDVVITVGLVMIPVGFFALGALFGAPIKKELNALIDKIDGLEAQ